MIFGYKSQQKDKFKKKTANINQIYLCENGNCVKMEMKTILLILRIMIM